MTTPNPDEARALLEQAGRLGSAARSGAGWPHIALLLGLGGLSAMFTVALYLVGRLDERLVWLPMAVMFLWLAILTVMMVVSNRATKAGFGGRWRTAMLVWAAAWVFSVVGGTVWWRGELWFAIASALLLTAVTTWAAWREARS